MVRWLGVVLALAQSAGVVPFDVGSMTIAPPTTLHELSRKSLGGEPSKLAWSPDGSLLYLQSRDGVGPAARYRHFQIRLGRQGLASLDREPDWAAEYWHHKVTEAAPGMPWLAVDVHVDQQRTRVAPFAGGFASGGTATGSEAASTVTLSFVTLEYLGVEIGHWDADEPKTGVTFGWGPTGTGAMTFVDKRGRLNLLDKERRQRTVARTEHVMLPAWSPDGNYIAFLEKRGRSRYTVMSIAMLRFSSPLQ